MTELELYKFTHDVDGPEPEMHWYQKELLVFLRPYWLGHFIKLLGDNYFDENTIDAKINGSGEIVFDLATICADFDIEPEHIHAKEANHE